ncbi:DUF559 domain-containing protein [Cellulomonas sp. ICMP 17802]|uniref:DUF559 domain-containing protein n=1 Tax=Cellulomonas sp. ICMP 17802 TaxID=3239199 RepID=UPI00351B1F92
MPDAISQRLAALGGAARRSELVRRRGDVDALRRAVDDGAVARVGRGVYCIEGAPDALVAAAAHGALVACVSAVALAGVAVVVRPEHPHLAAPRDRGVVRSTVRDAFPCVIHRELVPGERRSPGATVVPLATALARMLLCCPPDHAVVSIDSGVQRRLVTTAAIADSLGATAPVGARVVLARADGRSRSPIETLARLALRAAGLPVEVAVVVPMVGEVDLVVAGRVVVELDGFAYHSGPVEFREDRRRDRELALQGYVVLRFTAQDVLHDVARLVAVVRAAVGMSRR